MKPMKPMTAVPAFGLGLGMMATGTAQADTFGSGAEQFDIEFTTIRNPGNSANTTGYPSSAGSVAYVRSWHPSSDGTAQRSSSGPAAPEVLAAGTGPAPRCRRATQEIIWISRKPPGPSLILGSRL